MTYMHIPKNSSLPGMLLTPPGDTVNNGIRDAFTLLFSPSFCTWSARQIVVGVPYLSFLIQLNSKKFSAMIEGFWTRISI